MYNQKHYFGGYPVHVDLLSLAHFIMVYHTIIFNIIMRDIAHPKHNAQYNRINKSICTDKKRYINIAKHNSYSNDSISLFLILLTAFSYRTTAIL